MMRTGKQFKGVRTADRSTPTSTPRFITYKPQGTVRTTPTTSVSYWVIRSVGVPIFRDGFLFTLPGLTIEVAEQCSGIRSGISLFLVGILAGHIFLKSGWRKLALVAAVVPITIAKNGLRIVMLSLLGAYVDRQELSGPLHKAGGIPFFGVALVMLAVILWALRKGESRKRPQSPRDPDPIPRVADR